MELGKSAGIAVVGTSKIDTGKDGPATSGCTDFRESREKPRSRVDLRRFVCDVNSDVEAE